jgi:hypothetical protein
MKVIPGVLYEVFMHLEGIYPETRSFRTLKEAKDFMNYYVGSPPMVLYKYRRVGKRIDK